MKTIILVLYVTFFSFAKTFAVDFLLTDNNTWFDQTDQTTVDAVIDIKNITRAQADLILKVYLSPTLYNKLNIEIASDSISTLQIKLHQLKHTELLTIKNIIPILSQFGGTSFYPEIPLAIRIVNLKNHNNFISNISGIPIKTIQQIDQAVTRAKGTGKPVVVRYFLDDRKNQIPKTFTI